MKWLIIISFFIGLLILTFIIENPFKIKMIQKIENLMKEDGMGISLRSLNQPNNNTVGFAEYNGTWHIWNEIDDYYFNASSGMQFTNHYQNYWSKNIFCGVYDGTEHCIDKLPFTWTKATDNSTYVYIYGERTLLLGNKFWINYSLGTNDTSMSIDFGFVRSGNLINTSKISFKWKITNLSIPYEDEDVIFINGTIYPIDENRNFTGTDFFSIADSSSGEHLDMWYLSNSLVDINENVSITLPYNTTYHFDWVDAECSITCSTTAPATDPNIYETQDYTETVQMTYAGTCSGDKITTHQFDNQTAEASWYNIGSSTNLSTDGTNPLTHAVCRLSVCPHTLTVIGEESGSYNVRGYCQYGAVTQYSTTKDVTVLADSDAPNVTLILPENNSESHELTQNYTCFVNDSKSGIYEVQLWTNYTGVMEERESNTSGLDIVNYTFSSSPEMWFYNVLDEDTNNFGNSFPYGIAGNETHLASLSVDDKKVYLLNLTFDYLNENISISEMSFPNGIWWNKTNNLMYITDVVADKIFVYNWSNKATPYVANYSTNCSLTQMGDITGMGDKLYVLDETDILVTLNLTGGCLSNFSVASKTTIMGGLSHNQSVFYVGNGANEWYVYNLTGDYIRTRSIPVTNDKTQRFYTPSETQGGTLEIMYMGSYNNDKVVKLGYNDYGYYNWTCKAEDNLHKVVGETTTYGNMAFAWNGNWTINITPSTPSDCWTKTSNLLFIPTGCLYYKTTGGFEEI